MGVIHHNAVIATCSNKSGFDRVVEWIKNLPISKDIIHDDPKSLFVFGSGIANDYHTIVMVPDGSKEGWPHSAFGDELRAQFISKLNSEAYDDESSSWAWIEVGYGECGQKICDGNNRNRY